MSGPFDHFPLPGRLFDGAEPQEPPPPSLERLRMYLADRARTQPQLQGLRALDVLDEELADVNSEMMSSRRAELLRRSDSSQFAPRHDSELAFLARMQQNSRNTTEPHPNQSTSNPGGTRPNAGDQTAPASSQGGLPHREFEGLQTLQQVEDRLRQAHTSISDLFDDGLGNSTRSPLQPAHRDHSDNNNNNNNTNTEDDLDRPRAKRVKLDADDNREGPRGFRYGHYGQVVPRALEMEIGDCDGGSYEAHGKSSSPRNILADDHTVYCTKNDRCNIILKHQGGIPFCLKKLVIRAPKSGFDSPYSVREGMVFVAMHADDLLARTTQYQIAYTPSSRRRIRAQRRRARILDSVQPSADSGQSTFFDIMQTSFQDLERAHPARMEAVRLDVNRVLNASSHAARDQDSRRQTSTHGLRVTTDHDDASDDEATYDGGDDGDVRFSQDANPEDADQTTQLLAAEDTDSEGSEDSDDEDIGPSSLPHPQTLDQATSPPSELVRLARQGLEDRTRTLQPDRNGLAGQHGNQPTPPQNDPALDPQRFSLNAEQGSSFNEDPGNEEEDPSSSEVPEVMKPHARFSIEREKSMISIKFDPPVSGRFILIKLWSPCSGGNIDIQSVIAKGFVGPRFFPSVDFR